MKVLQFICSTGFYGAERWVLALSKHLPDSVTSELVVTQEPGTEELELVKQFAPIGTTHRLAMQNRFDVGAVGKLAALIKERQIDVLHTHGYKSDIIGVMAARKAGIPCVVTPHGFENAADIKLRAFIWLGCLAMKYAAKVVPLSRQLMEDVKKFNIPASKLAYIQNGVDLSEVEAVRLTKQPKPDEQVKTIGFVGQMISRKNIHAILDCFDTLYRKRQDIRLVLLGDGDARPALEEYCTTLNSSAAIEFLGFRNDRLALLRDFDLFVMTSTLEGIPRCLMEACAMEIPVSAYNIAGVDQLITNKESGLLATLHDQEQLQKDWECLLDQPKYAAQLATNARTFVETHFSAQRMANEYYELFRELAEEQVDA
ncbi:glycosyltransferase [Alteromonas aestuariivivens]|uniref:Glycosyltransferase n=1 Tax=Alteromonas aestuariivivens TaxID=1938339 RepID=A0A3D8MF59_9ALTE|nr:glycosyltransferase [Alteromonas aestuariivivens]RDV29201.1 glycosyltransferase [Alteromonas aestuariivivens]